MKKRNKKYNPNKLGQIYRAELAKTYNLWMSFDDVEVTAESDKLRAKGVKGQAAIQSMYDFFDGDLIVPIFNDLIVDNTAFFVGMDSYYYHQDDPSDIKDSAIQFDIPAMTYDQFKLGGSDAKVSGGEIKRRWEGLEKETDAIHEPFLEKGYKLFKCMCYMRAEVKFKGIEEYSKFKADRVLRGMRRKFHLQGMGAAA